MNIVLVGINHKTAPLAVREKMALSAEEQRAALGRLRGVADIDEAVVLSTCNRTEWAAVGGRGLGAGDVVAVWAALKEQAPEDFDEYLYEHVGSDVCRHLCRVASGLDSMVLGETEILHQVKDAYRRAQKCGTVGKILHHMLDESLNLAKRAHAETAIGRHATSLSYAVTEVAGSVFDRLDDRRLLLVGAGKMAQLTAGYLREAGVGGVTVANRTRRRAESLAGEVGGQVIELSAVGETLASADLLVTATGSADQIVDGQTLARAQEQRGHRPLFVMDLAVPRDVAPDAGEVEGVLLYDIDDLRSVVDDNMTQRRREARQVEAMIEDEVRHARHWLRGLQADPVVQALHDKAAAVRQQETEKALRRLPDLSKAEADVIRQLARSLTDKLLMDPTIALKQRVAEDDGRRLLTAAAELFDLEPAPPLEGPADEPDVDAV